MILVELQLPNYAGCDGVCVVFVVNNRYIYIYLKLILVHCLESIIGNQDDGLTCLYIKNF